MTEAELKALLAGNERFREALTKIYNAEDPCNEASSEQACIAERALKGSHTSDTPPNPWLLVEREGGTATIEAGDWVRLLNGFEAGPVSVLEVETSYSVRFADEMWMANGKQGFLTSAFDITHVRKAKP